MVFTLLDVVLFSTYFILLFFSIFWLLVLFTSGNEEEKKKKLKRQPMFSVIVPAYNEEKSVKATLNSIINLDYPKEKLEVIVINDGSTDKTKEIIENFISNNPLNKINLINQKNQGKGKAMNVGLEKAKGEFFACLDADSFVASDAIEEMLPYFEKDQLVGAVCPLLKVKKPENVLQKVQWCEYIINMFHRYLNAKLNCIHVTPGPFSVYRTQVIKDIGWFDEKTITEDLEIAIRLQKNHYKIIQTFDTIVETVAPNSWKQLFRQRVRWYKGSVDNTINYKKLIFNKKYGDFGYIRMPTIILSGIIAIVLSATLLQALIKKIFYSYLSLRDINFDIITLIKNYSFNFNILSLPILKIFIASTLFIMSFYIMIKSYKLVRENITKYGRTWASLVTYLFVYGLFLTGVWVYIAYMFVSKKRNFWS